MNVSYQSIDATLIMIEMLAYSLRRLRTAPVLLGRWCRTDKKLNDIKVDLANIDHCGTCVHNKIKETKPIDKEFIIDSKGQKIQSI